MPPLNLFLTSGRFPVRFDASCIQLVNFIKSIYVDIISIHTVQDRRPSGAFSLSAASSVLPQHRIANSQPTVPLEKPSNNMIGYSGLPQSYSHLSSNFQQGYPGSDKVSLADLNYNLPQHGASMSRFPGASATAGYGNYGMPSNVPGSYLQNSPSPPMIPNSGYDDLFHRQYKDRDHFTPLQQVRFSVQKLGSLPLSIMRASAL